MRRLKAQRSLRWLLLTVAIMGIAFSAIRYKQLSTAYRRRADWHNAEIKKYDYYTEILESTASRDHLALVRGDGSPSDGRHRQMASLLREMVSKYGRLSVYHSELERKYRRAAARPWSGILPDSPPPLDRQAAEAEYEARRIQLARAPGAFHEVP